MLSLEKQLLFLLSSTESVDVKRLIEIYEARGTDHQLVRNALARLKKDGFAVSPERSRYAITGPGRTFLESINRKDRLLDRAWDGRWLSVLFEVPEAERKKRDAFRGELLQLGFAALFKSVYVTPWDYAEEALRFADSHGLRDRVTLSSGVFVHGGPTARQARDLWRLEELSEEYRLRLRWLRAEFEPAIEPLLAAPGDGLELFARFLELGESVADMSLSDPMLPEELLEADWPGRSGYREMQACLVRIARAIPDESPWRPFVSRFLQP